MNTFPVVPYLIRIETLRGVAEMDFEATEWHLPSAVIISGSETAKQDLRLHFDQYLSGMWGYPVENLEFCSPMDIHANLTTNETYYHDPLIQKFEVVGYVPVELPDSIHPDNHDPDDDTEDSE